MKVKCETMLPGMTADPYPHATPRLLDRAPGRSRRARRRAADAPFDDLLRAARAGGSWALEELYRRHDPAVRRYLRTRAGDDADDVASQTWIDAARNLGRFCGGEDDFRGWIFTIARRRLTDHGRRRARRPEVAATAGMLDAVTSREDPETTAADALDGEAAARRITEILPSAQAEIVLLRVVGGLSVEEVAELTGKRPGTVRVTQHRALRRLARDLDG